MPATTTYTDYKTNGYAIHPEPLIPADVVQGGGDGRHPPRGV
ncbi:MAG: hypothetical protein R2911_19950 [Caldilineaceae bacterium]